MPTPHPSAATDVSEFITDLNAGMFERMFSAALSDVAAAAVDNDKVGEVAITFSFKKIPGTHQVQVEHRLKFSRPTASGKATEEAKHSTPMHVGKNGRLSLAPENQLSFIDRTGHPVN